MNSSLIHRIMKTPEKYLYYLYIAGILFMHIFINTNLDDDIITREITGSHTLLSWVTFRYENWSARFLHEGIAYYLVWHPIIWRILNSAIMIAIPQLLKYLTGIKGLYSCFCYLLIMWIPVSALMNAGWMCTTITYLWTAFWGLCSFSLAKYYVDNKGHYFRLLPLLFIISLIFACNHELMAALIFVVICYCIIRHRVNCRHLSVLFIVGLLLDIIQIIFIITAPGNANRILLETQEQFPDFAELSFFKKTGLGIMRAFEFNIINHSFLFFILTALLALGALIYGKSLLGRLFSTVPFITELYFIFISTAKRYKQPATNIFSTRYLIYIIIAIICLCAMCTAIYEIFSYDSTKGIRNFSLPLFLITLLITGIGTVAVMGFSPTIYASGNRTATFMFFTWIYLILLIGKRILSHPRFPKICKRLTVCLVLLVWGISYTGILIEIF